MTTTAEQRENWRRATQKYRQSHKEKLRIALKDWKLKHSDKVREQHHRHNKRIITFTPTGQQKSAGRIVRSGTCSKCQRSIASGLIKRTQLHHLAYDSSNPFLHTIELCVGCHRALHMEDPEYRRKVAREKRIGR